MGENGENKKRRIKNEEVDLPKKKEKMIRIEKEIEKELEDRIQADLVEEKPKKKKKLSIKRLIILILIVLIILSPIIVLGVAHFMPKNEPKTELKDKKEKKKEEKEPEIVEEPKLKIVDEDSTSRPFAIMINNHKEARPLQSGLQDAYIIYEIIVEGGITRYMALFLDQNTERIGSVRSARHYFLDYALENDAIYVHHGNSPQALADFGRLGIDRIEVSESKTGWRDRNLNVAWEHKLFTSIEKLNKGLGSKRTTRNKDLLLKYSIEPLNLAAIPNNEVANKVSINYSNAFTTSYEYDPVEKVYKRFVNGVEHKDYVTKKQYTFKNIITYKVRNYSLNDPENKGRQGLENVGSGSGYYISEGYAIPIHWSKASRGSQTKYTLEDGTDLVVNDGNTFIQIQPTGRNLGIS